VSIITPSLNQGRYLRACLQSVEAQDYPRIEHIVIDGGSSDETVDVLRSSPQLAYWTSQPDKGQAAAINEGMRRARGPICSWLNADDLLLPSAVRIAVSCLGADVAAVYGDRLTIDAKGNVLDLLRHPPYYRTMFARNITIPQETTFFWKDLFDEVGGLDEDLHFALDFDLWVRLARRRALLHVPAVLGAYRFHEGSKTAEAAVRGSTAPRWLVEHGIVYRRLFGRALPTGLEAAYYRLCHHARRVGFARSGDYRRTQMELAALRSQPLAVDGHDGVAG